jgi:hypothetical protein
MKCVSVSLYFQPFGGTPHSRCTHILACALAAEERPVVPISPVVVLNLEVVVARMATPAFFLHDGPGQGLHLACSGERLRTPLTIYSGPSGQSVRSRPGDRLCGV